MTDPSPSRAVMVVLAYLWPLAIVPFVLSKDDPDVHWHAKHGLVLVAAELLVLFAIWVMVGLASYAAFGLGCALGVLVVLIWVAILIVHLVAILKALSGARLIIPGVSEYADRF